MKTNLLRGYLVLGISLTLILMLIYFNFIVEEDLSNPSIWKKLKNYRWKNEYGELNGPDISATDPKLLLKLHQKFLISPSSKSYNLEDGISDPSMGQSDVIKKIFSSDKKEGFFVECGALDGETRSNTLFFEKEWGWEGLLIEADPLNFLKLVEKNRKAWASESCLSTTSYPIMVSFEQNMNKGKIFSLTPESVPSLSELNSESERVSHTNVQCFPLETYLTALNRTTVSYFSLDVEGAELDVLRTIDFTKYDIRSLSVEFIHDREGKDKILEFMRDKGYLVLAEITHPNWLANDFIFIKQTFFDGLSEKVKEELKNL